MFLGLLAPLLLSGCGYQFGVEGAGPVIGGPAGGVPSADVQRMSVPNFENKTLEPNLEVKFTSYTRHEFSAGGGVRVVSDGQNADLVLKGQVLSVVLPTISFSQFTTLESRATVTVKATVENIHTGKTIWTQTSTASSEFFVTNDLQFNRVLQSRALEQAGRLIASDLATRFLAHLEAGAGTQKAATQASGTDKSGRTDGQAQPGRAESVGPTSK